MPKRIELKSLAEIGRGYAIIDDSKVEVRVSGIMGVLKAWLIGKENKLLGNIVNGKLIRETDTRDFHGLLITQSGRQMFYGQWRDGDEKVNNEENRAEENRVPATENPYSPLPDFHWEKITGRDFPSTNERIRFALSNDAFFAAFKKHGYYLFGKDGERFALAIKHAQDEPQPFPYVDGATEAGEYMYVVV
ncbi:MAG: hypothetical protein ACI4SS_04605 [Clostridia bacterium]